MDNYEATKWIKGLYSKKGKMKGRSQKEIVDEAIQILQSIEGPKNHFVINTFLTLCLRFKCPDQIQAVWTDIESLSHRSRSISECYSLIIMCCIESNDIGRFIQVLSWMHRHRHSLSLHMGHISKLIHSANPTTEQLKAIENAMKNGVLPHNEFLQSALIKCYGNLHEIPSAMSIYHSMAPLSQNRIITNTLLMAMVESGFNNEAIQFYKNVNDGEHFPSKMDAMTHFMALKACTNLNDLDRGHDICSTINFGELQHDETIKLKTQMIDFYGSFHDVTNALHLFDSIPVDEVDIVCIGAILKVLVNNDCHSEAMEMYVAFDRFPNISKDAGIHVLALKSCSKRKDLAKGEAIWSAIPSQERTINVITTMIDLYGHCHKVDKALNIFHSDPKIARNVIATNAMLSAFTHCERYDDALALYQNTSIDKSATSHVLALTACSKGRRFECGRNIHQQMESSMLQNVQIQTALIDLFGTSGDIKSALGIFDSVKRDRMNIVTINAMMTAYIHNECYLEALDLFHGIVEYDCISKDSTTFTMAIKACGHLEDQQNGERIYNEIPENVKWQNIQIETAMIQLYGQCKMIQKARNLFDGIEDDRKTIVTINSMLTALINNGQDLEALELYGMMESKYSHIPKDHVLYAVAIKAATNSGQFEIGQDIHREIKERQSNGSLKRGNGDTECHLINMYSKCGMVEAAESILEEMKVNKNRKYFVDITLWNEMVNAHLRNSDVGSAEEVIKRMKRDTSLKPNYKTMSLLLNGCSHSGDIEGATRLCNEEIDGEMKYDPFIIGTLVDCSARKGHLYDAMEWIYRYEKVKKKGIGREEDYAMWMALLHGCRQQQNMSLAKHIHDEIGIRFKRDEAKMKSAAVLFSSVRAEGRDTAVPSVQEF